MLKLLTTLLLGFVFVTEAAPRILRGASTVHIGPTEPPQTVSGLNSGLVAFWKLNETTGNFTDSVGGATLTNVNVTSSSSGKFGNAASFNGTTSYLIGPTNVDLQLGNRQSFTIAGWFNANVLGNQFILSKNDGALQEYYIRLTGGDKITFGFVSGTAGGFTAIVSNVVTSASQWYFYCASVDAINDLIALEINNDASKSWTNPISGVLNSSDGPFRIGQMSTNGFFNGRQDSIGIWKRLLTAEEKRALYIAGDSTSGEWPFGVKYPDPEIEIYSPSAYQVVQRNGSNQGTISIIGSLRNVTNAVQASWNEGPWTTVFSDGKGYFTYNLTGLSVGQGSLKVRTSGRAYTNVVNYVGVGDVYLVIGQSNASGRGNQTNLWSHASLKPGLFCNDYKWRELNDYTDRYFLDEQGRVPAEFDNVSNDQNSATGSLWPLLATHIMSSNIPVAFITAAKGASYIEQWQPRTNHQDRSTLFGSAVNKVRQVGGAKAALFWQGESETITNVTQVQHFTWYTNLTANLYVDLGIKTMPVILQQQTDPLATNQVNIQNALAQAATDDPNTLTPVDARDQITDDVAHLRTAAKQQLMAQRFWDNLKALFYP